MDHTEPDDGDRATPEEKPELLERRRLCARLSVGLGAAAGVMLAVPTVGFVLGPLRKRPPSLWSAVGEVGDFALGATVNVTLSDPSPLPWAGVTARTAAWLRREAPNRFIAFAVNCAHLGCPVRWLPDAELFMCPCHGGVYYADGAVAAGPPPHGLWRYPVRIREGHVELRVDPLPIG